MSPALQDTLLQLFELVHCDPDSLPSVPIDECDEGSIERHLLERFRGMMEQVHERIYQLKLAEQHVREQEELYHSAFDATNDGLFIGDLDGTIVEVNPAACDMYGYSHEEMIGLTGIQLTHPDSHLVVEELNATLPPLGTRPRLLALRKDGTTFYTEGQVAVFPYQGKLHRVAAVRDITAQVQAEEQLREREEQYRSIFEATYDGIDIFDADGFFVEVNPAFCTMFGYTREELIGMHASVLVAPQYRPVLDEVLKTLGTSTGYQTVVGEGVRKDGTTIYTESHGTPFIYKGKRHLLGVSRDITERVEAEQQLREREEQYRSVFEATGDGLFVLDLDGFIVEANPAAYTQLGYTYQEMIGLHRSAIVAPDYHSLVPEYLRVIEMGDQFQGRAIDMRKDGSTFPVEVLGRAFTYKGQPHTLSVVRDITKQVEAEEQLREREEQYRGVFENTYDGLVLSDLENGCYVEVNPAFCRMFGYSREELIGMHSSALAAPVDQHLVDEVLETLKLVQGYQTVVGQGLRKDGTVFYVESQGTTFTYRGKPHSLAVVRDITERVEAERQLREREQQYRSIFEASTDGLLICDVEDGNVVEVNPAACKMYGYSYEEFCGMAANTITPTEYQPLLREARQRIQTGEQLQTRSVALRKDGTLFPVETHAGPFIYKGQPHLLAIVRDISEQIQFEQQLREREEQYRSVFEATSDGLDVLDLDGCLVEVNPSFCQIYGYTREELIGMNVSSLVPPASHSIATEGMETLKAGRDYKVAADAQGLRKDGTIFSAEAHGIPFTYRGQRHILGVVRDITERVEAERQLREREALYRGIFEATSDGIAIIDQQGRYVEVNPATCQDFGYTREELIGMHVSALSATKRVTAQALETLQAGRSYVHSHLTGAPPSWGLRKDGSVFPFDAQGSPITYRGQPHFLVVARDITVQVQAQEMLEQRVEERTRELASLLEVSHTVASTLQLKPLVGLILDQLKMVVDYTGAAILTVEGDDLVFLDSRSPTPEEQLMQLRLLPQRLGPIWEAISSGESLLLPDMRDESPMAESLRVGMGGLMDTTFSYVRACLFVPLTLKDQTMGMLVLTSSETAAFTQHHADLALAIANQAAVAIANARLYAQAQVLAAVEERQRLARELHDSVSQALYGISLGVHTARMQLDRNPKDLAESLDYVLELADAALVEMRALIFELRPESLETEGLVTALTKQAAALQARQHVEVNTDLCAEPELPLKAKQDLYRVAQEALHNTVKHAHASRIDLRLHQTSESVLLEVCDDGRGFDAAASFPGHLGLHSMQERVRGLGGELQIVSNPGQGTCIRVHVPARVAM